MEDKKIRKFEVRISLTEGGYRVDATDPRGNRSSGFVPGKVDDFKFKWLASEATRAPVTVRSAGNKAMNAAKELGSDLYSIAFPGVIAHWLDAAIDATIDDPETRVRIQLDLNDAPELARLPWEYLFHPGRGRHLATNDEVTLVRYAQSPEPVVGLEVEPPLRILGVACSPVDLPGVSVEHEREQLAGSLKKLTDAGLVEVDWATDNSFSTVARMLKARRYDVFHFIGHGAFYEQSDRSQGVLMFEKANGRHDPVMAEHVADILRRRVKLAVINACEGARGNTDPAAGIASSLLLQGIPAVIAMQFEISDAAGVCFTKEFYSALAEGRSIDTAVTSARHQMSVDFRGSAEWATPVLFVRAGDGQVLRLIKPAAPRPETAEAREVAQKVWGDVGRLVGKTVASDWAKDVMGRVQRPPDSPEEIYLLALEAMTGEEWDAADRLFGLLNKRRPGYRDMALRWREVERQRTLDGHYKKLVDQYRQGNWQKVVEAHRNIAPLDASYRDSARLLADAMAQLEAQSQPPARPKPPAPPANLTPRPQQPAPPANLTPRPAPPAPPANLTPRPQPPAPPANLTARPQPPAPPANLASRPKPPSRSDAARS